MQIHVLDLNLSVIGIIDTVDSFRWTERYNDPGDFEIYTGVTAYNLGLLKKGYRLVIPDSKRMMTIENIGINTKHDEGSKLIVTGRSIESLIDRRIVLTQILIDASVQAGIEMLLNQNVIASTFPERNFPGFIFEGNLDPAVTVHNLKGQYYSENMLDLIVDICKNVNLGFKVVLDQYNRFVFSLYAGKDRSYNQSTYSYVVFSPTFDNLISSNYYESIRLKKNFALIKGDPAVPTGPSFNNQIWTTDVGTGYNRLEMFVDASDLSKYYQDTTNPISDADYYNQLKQRGWQELSKQTEISLFDGQIRLDDTYMYNVDFFLGDIVQIEDEFGIQGSARIIELTFSENTSGFHIYPTLESI